FPTPARIPPRGGRAKERYPGAGGFEVLELPYQGKGLSLVVLLPRSAGGLSDLEKKLTGANLRAWTARLGSRPVEVHLPRFKMGTSLPLKESLESLGMKRVFRDPQGKDGAQLGGVSDSPAARGKLFLGKVFHKAFVEVTEKGAEASQWSTAA